MIGPGRLDWAPVAERLVAAPVWSALRGWSGAAEVLAAPIDDTLADTAAFCAHYAVRLEESANCVVVAGRRGQATTYAACVVLATTRADINGVVRRLLAARKASFAPVDAAVQHTGMDYGGITPIGLPDGWPLLVDRRVDEAPVVVIGSGLRRSKLALPGAALAGLPGALVVELAG
jgi:prolyl-tRNA editing enzyme YbaK/EbsC (Cys-tRNA(Pro) deacylase)